ncbi:hypothetical protein VKT23_019113 [Stygiomarasmius scandens]|uniref:RGS domain-containing protein n=1 Tax=Marasmiellus scandens TaxID=2682957 RepID=A0ABR1IRF1_9AGAR
MDAELEKDPFYFLRASNWNDINSLSLSSELDPYSALAIFEGFYDSLVSHCRYYRTHPNKSEPAQALALRAMVQQKFVHFVASYVRHKKHEEWYLDSSEEAKHKTTGLIWTPTSKLPGPERNRSCSLSDIPDEREECRELQVTHASSSGSSKLTDSGETNDESEVRQNTHEKHNSVYTLSKADVMLSTAFTSHALRPVSFDPLSSAKSRRRKYTYSEKVSLGVALATHYCLQKPPVMDDPTVLFHSGFIRLGKDIVEDVAYDVGSSDLLSN